VAPRLLRGKLWSITNMPYYAQIDNQSKVVGIVDAHSPISSPTSILIQSFDHSILGKFWNGISFGDFVPTTLDEAKQVKIQQIRDHFNAIVDTIKQDAAPYEVATWETQRQEYVAWTVNSSSPTPYCSALATVRGLTLQDLMTKIGAKISGLATVQGTQHRLEKLVEAATTIDDVNAVTLP
jgi:antitoxin component HigA of HigAB toxin-antitoxin module